MDELTDEKAVLENMVVVCREVEDERNVGWNFGRRYVMAT